MNGAKTDGATLMHGALRVQPSDCGLFQVETGCNSGSICCPLKLGSLSIRESQTKPRSGEMSYERGLSRENYSCAACSEIFLCSQPLKLHCGLAVILRRTQVPDPGVCSPILLGEELSAERAVLCS